MVPIRLSARWIGYVAWVVLWGLGTGAAGAQDFTEGFEYRRLTRPVEHPADGPITVEEFFWYGCPACASLEPSIRAYARDLPAEVEFRQVAAVLNPRWEIHGRAYYTAEVLGVLDRVHAALFEAIHREGRALNDRTALAQLFAEQGVAEADFNRTFQSFAVQTRLNQARDAAKRYGIRAVPAVVINGRYLTDRGMAGGNSELIEVIRHLVAKERG